MNDIERLEIKGDIITDEAVRKQYATDASLFEILPSVVVAPKDSEDLRILVNFVTEHPGFSLTARSGGTGMDGGALSESIVVDFTKYFTHIEAVVRDGAFGYAITEPGVFYRDFEHETLAKNLIMPSYPASREICTVGGMAANNAGGELTLRYGKTENYVRRLKAVLADGNEYTLGPLTTEEREAKMAQNDFEGKVYRELYELISHNYEHIEKARPQVSKNSAGYFLWNVWDKETDIFDLSKLFVGSQGTLGLMTEIEYGLVTRDPHEQMVILFLDDLSNIGNMVETVLAHNPTTFESYDDKTLRLALKFFWEFIKRLGVKNVFTIVRNSLPEMFSIIRHGLPKLVLQITFEGEDKEQLHQQATELVKNVAQYSPRYTEVIKTRKEDEEYWLIRRESFNLLRHKVKGMKTAPFVDDIVVPVTVLPEFLPKLNALFEPYKNVMVYNIAGHIGNGNFHIIPLMDLSNPKVRGVIPEVAQQVYDLVLAYGGSTTGEHNDGIMRTPFLRQMYGEEVYQLFGKVKNIFDPKGIFNPHKKIGGTLHYAVEHMKTHN